MSCLSLILRSKLYPVRRNIAHELGNYAHTAKNLSLDMLSKLFPEQIPIC